MSPPRADLATRRSATCHPLPAQEHFANFCEDYNTATMPSKKYYDLRAWYIKEQQRAARRPADEPVFERTDFDDEASRKRDVDALRQARATETAAVMARAMKSGDGLAADMLEQQQLRSRMRQAYATGDTDAARGMSERLDPSKVTAEDIKKKFGAYAPSAQRH